MNLRRFEISLRAQQWRLTASLHINTAKASLNAARLSPFSPTFSFLNIFWLRKNYALDWHRHTTSITLYFALAITKWCKLKRLRTYHRNLRHLERGQIERCLNLSCAECLASCGGLLRKRREKCGLVGQYGGSWQACRYQSFFCDWCE